MRGSSGERETEGPTDVEADRYLAARERRLKVLEGISFIVDVPIVVGVVWFGVRAFRSGHAGDRFRTPLTVGSASIADFAVVMGVAIGALIVGGLWSWVAGRRKRGPA